MGDELSSGQARDCYTHTHTRTHRPTDAGDDNTRRPKLASGKNGCNYLSMLGLKLNHVNKYGPWESRDSGSFRPWRSGFMRMANQPWCVICNCILLRSQLSFEVTKSDLYDMSRYMRYIKSVLRLRCRIVLYDIPFIKFACNYHVDTEFTKYMMIFNTIMLTWN